MIDIIYAERDALQYEMAQRILTRFPRAQVIECDLHGEVFNRSAQNFRLQKSRPALILAVKNGEKVLPAPAEYSVGGNRNYYFSHMLNCLYDCRYCFLQGIYRSANYLLFVNFEDFVDSIRRKAARHPQDSVWFFSGYDCDSLAFEPVTRFAEYFIPQFESLPNANLELRTKSTQIRSLLGRSALPNVVIAFSFTTESAGRDLEHKVPDMNRRIEALSALQQRGWPVALRFDPLIYEEHFAREFGSLCRRIFARVDARGIHSITLGSFRLPREFFKRMKKLYPREKLFARFLQDAGGTMGYRSEIESELLDTARGILCEHVPSRLIYRMRAD
jgi:spore photoproduct lyase